MAKILLLTAGFISLAIGLAGILLPLIPGTPLCIFAAFCFARSSPSSHKWLLSQPRLGPLIERWEREGSIPLHTKQVITVSLLLACGLSFAMLRTAVAAIGFLTLLTALLTYIWTRPSAARGLEAQNH